VTSTFEGLAPEEQLKAWKGRAEDERPSLGTGYPSIDSKLFRRGFQPGTFVILGGRTHTRKTSVALNIIVNLLREDIPVGFVGLDENTAAYIAKLCSVMTGEHDALDPEWLEENWNEREAHEARKRYLSDTFSKMNEKSNLTITRGYRPGLGTLQAWLEDADGNRPHVVLIDFLGLLARGKFSGQDNTRIPRLAEDVSVWTNENGLVTIALHQVSRQRNELGQSNHGDRPCTLEQLKYGGEEYADVVLGTYRPSLNYLGNLSEEQAEEETADKDEKWKERWEKARDRVQRYQHSTFLQLLKNRPSMKGLNLTGVELVNPASSMFMCEYDAGQHDDEQASVYNKESKRASSD